MKTSKTIRLIISTLWVWVVCLLFMFLAKQLGYWPQQKVTLILSALVLPFYHVYRIFWKKEHTDKSDL